VWSCGWAGQPNVNPAGNGRVLRRRVSTGRPLGPMSTSRATIWRCTWTSSQVLPRRRLLLMVTGSPPVATPVGCEPRWLRLCGVSSLSSLGDAALVRAPRSSSPTSVHPQWRFGAAVEVAASRWSPGLATLSRRSPRAPAYGKGSSELEPRRSSIRPGASVSERRWPPHGGLQGRRRLRRARVWAGHGQVRVLLRTRSVGRLRSRAGEGPKAPSWSGRASVLKPGTARLGGGIPSLLGRLRRRCGRPDDQRVIAACGGDRSLVPMRSGEGHPPGVRARVDRGCFAVRPTDQRGSHDDGNIGVPRGTWPLVRCAFSCFLSRVFAAEDTPGIDHPARWVDPLPGWAERRHLPGQLGGCSCRASTWWFRARLPPRGEIVGRRQAIAVNSVLGGRTVVWSVICGASVGCGFGRGPRRRET
jgi:hypothetical protein